MYCGGCIFVDHATGHLHVEFQKHLNTHETLEAKESFELMCHDHGVIPQAYHSDNGSSFTSSGFTARLREFAQVTSFAGAGAHHHNGTAERAIQTIMNMSCTMMLHAAIHWPDVADSTLWPMAVAHAVYLYNHAHASIGHWNFTCGHVYQNSMGTAEVSRRSCLGMSSICIG
jgi:transposase InsO family protein